MVVVVVVAAVVALPRLSATHTRSPRLCFSRRRGTALLRKTVSGNRGRRQSVLAAAERPPFGRPLSGGSPSPTQPGGRGWEV